MKKVKDIVDSGIKKSKINHYLGNFFFIPAVQDIEKETTYSARGKTNINKLMNFILDQMRDEKKEKERNEQIREIMKKIYQINNPSSRINQLSKTLNKTLKEFDGSTVKFGTELPSIDRLVRDSFKVYLNDGVETEVQEKGHGLQRYFMVTLFKAWSERLRLKEKDKNKNKKSTQSDVNTSAFFAIEEPELFLHPQYQRLMQSYLKEISETDNNQILLNTHSPNFIEFENYNTVAKVVKIKDALGFSTKIIQPIEEKNGKLVKKDLIHSHGRDYEKFKKINKLNLEYFMNPNRSELFFADRVVLVEGETEKLMFQKWAEYFFPEEVRKLVTTTYLDCNGKFNMQVYQEMLNGFKIPYVVIVDTDEGSGDDSMARLNNFIEKFANKGTGHYIELKIDFENEFNITGHKISRSGRKKHKPFQAFIKYFNSDNGEPKIKELDKLKIHPKLKQIFFSIYQKNIANEANEA